MTTLSKTKSNLIERIAADYPQFKFQPGKQEHWSPKTRTITYQVTDSTDEPSYGLLHELAHALLGHNSYKTDFELLKLESLAWREAAKLGRKYGLKIDEDHIQNCLDTYRDWLHRRSKCPTCGTHVLQTDASTYRCFNCGTSWQVSSGRFARSYRRKD
jgi:predicted RNA-binding Zn-ribbon protein involved in translation (DUF1610 family)